jgi:hypothetical protein
MAIDGGKSAYDVAIDGGSGSGIPKRHHVAVRPLNKLDKSLPGVTTHESNFPDVYKGGVGHRDPHIPNESATGDERLEDKSTSFRHQDALRAAARVLNPGKYKPTPPPPSPNRLQQDDETPIDKPRKSGLEDVGKVHSVEPHRFGQKINLVGGGYQMIPHGHEKFGKYKPGDTIRQERTELGPREKATIAEMLVAKKPKYPNAPTPKPDWPALTPEQHRKDISTPKKPKILLFAKKPKPPEGE